MRNFTRYGENRLICSILLVLLVVMTVLVWSLDISTRNENQVFELQNMPSIAEYNEKARQDYVLNRLGLVLENTGDNNEINVIVINK